MRAKSIFTGIAVIAVLFLVLSITAVSKVLSADTQTLLRGTSAQPIAAKFLPKRSPLVASFLVNPDRLSKFAKLATQPSDRATLRNELSSFKQKLKQTLVLDYDKDIQSWLGQEVTLAVTTTDVDRQSENGLQMGYLIALEIAKLDQAKKSIDAFWQRLAISGADLLFEQYQGLPIIYATATAKQPALAGTILGKFAIFANDLKVIRNAINDLQVPDLALANFDTYQTSLKQLSTGHVGIAFVNLDELGRWGGATGALPANLANLPPAGLTLGLGLDRQGIRAETILATDKPLFSQQKTTGSQSKGGQHKALPLIPKGSSVIVGRDLSQTWQQLTAALQPYPELSGVLNGAIASIETDTGFNLVNDLFNWIKGDYAIGLLPSKAPNLDASWVLVAEKADPNLVDPAIVHLDDLARNKTKQTVGEISMGKNTLTVWTKLSAIAGNSKKQSSSVVTGAVTAVHSQVGDEVLLANSVDAIELALASDRNSIVKSPSFKTISASLPAKNTGFAYLNQGIGLAWLEESLPILKSLNLDEQPLLSHIKAVNIAGSAANANDPDSILRGQIFIVVK